MELESPSARDISNSRSHEVPHIPASSTRPRSVPCGRCLGKKSRLLQQLQGIIPQPPKLQGLRP